MVSISSTSLLAVVIFVFMTAEMRQDFTKIDWYGSKSVETHAPENLAETSNVKAMADASHIGTEADGQGAPLVR